MYLWFQLKSRAGRKYLAILLLWATARLLFTRVSLIYIVDEFFIFSLLVFLKARGVSSRFHLAVFIFGVNQEILEAERAQGSHL